VPAAAAPRRDRSLTIGEAAARLSAEFPGIRPETLRALEQHGLVLPERTSSGFRRYTERDLEAVRGALTEPPRPRAEESEPPEPPRSGAGPDDASAGRARSAARGTGAAMAPPGPCEPESASAAAPSLSQTAARRRAARWPDPEYFTPELGEVALGREGLARAAGIAERWLDELAAYGLISGRDPASGADLLVARAAAELLGYGIEPRHLRPVAASAEGAAALVRAARGGSTGAATAQTAAALVRLEAALLRAALLDD
jgi:MerR family regulatory protein